MPSDSVVEHLDVLGQILLSRVERRVPAIVHPLHREGPEEALDDGIVI